MVPTISIGPLVIPTDGLVLILGIWVVLTVVERSARKLELDPEKSYTLASLVIASGFVGARLVFVALHWEAFRNNLTGIIWPLNSGYEVWAGVMFGLAAGVLYGRARELPAAATLDALAPGIITGLLVLSLADFLAGPGYGIESSLPWAIDVYGIQRHPVQIYEIVVAILALAAWRLVFDRRAFPGQLFYSSIAVYAAGKLFVEAFRADPWLTSGGYHVVQIVSLLALLVCLVMLARRADVSESPVSAS